MSGGRNDQTVTASIVTALDEENGYLNEVLKSRCDRVPTDRPYKSSIWKVKSDPNKTIAVASIGRMGNVRSAAMTAAMWRYHTSPLIILLGIAGILDTAQFRLGDVILSADVKTRYPNKLKQLNTREDVVVDLTATPREPSASYSPPFDGLTEVDSRELYFDNGYLRHIRDKASCGKGLNAIQSYIAARPDRRVHLRDNKQHPDNISAQGTRKPRIQSATVFSWGMVVDHDEYRQFLLHKNEDHSLDYYPGEAADGKGIASVDMESFGFFAFFEELSRFDVRMTPTRITVRGLSDHAGSKTKFQKDTKDSWRRVALENAALTAIDFIENAHI